MKQYVLRFWESEFPELKPSKNRAGNRIYKRSDIKLIFLIKKLLYDDKYTIEGARQKLALLYQRKAQQVDTASTHEKKQDLANELKNDMLEILAILDNKDTRGVAQSG
ncbi:MAG: MerR family transcriptional regulator [Candidatus Zhuqueibacterota bacterium]